MSVKNISELIISFKDYHEQTKIFPVVKWKFKMIVLLMSVPHMQINFDYLPRPFYVRYLETCVCLFKPYQSNENWKERLHWNWQFISRNYYFPFHLFLFINDKKVVKRKRGVNWRCAIHALIMIKRCIGLVRQWRWLSLLAFPQIILYKNIAIAFDHLIP